MNDSTFKVLQWNDCTFKVLQWNDCTLCLLSKLWHSYLTIIIQALKIQWCWIKHHWFAVWVYINLEYKLHNNFFRINRNGELYGICQPHPCALPAKSDRPVTYSKHYTGSSLFERWKQEGSKSYWIQKQIEPFFFHPSTTVIGGNFLCAIE